MMKLFLQVQHKPGHPLECSAEGTEVTPSCAGEGRQGVELGESSARVWGLLQHHQGRAG